MNQVQTRGITEIQINLATPDFEELVTEVIDETFMNLGLKVKQAFYHFLKIHYELNKEDIPNRIGDFVDALEKVFGAGASLIEIEVVKTLQDRVPSFTYVLAGSNLSFEGYLTSLRKHIEGLD